MPRSVLDLIIRSRKSGSGSKDVERDLKGVEAQSGKTAKALGGLGKAAKLAAVAGIAALSVATVRFVKDAIDLSSQMEEMRSKFNVVFGKEAPRAARAIEDFADRMGRSRLELLGMAAALQDTFVPMGLTRQAAAGLSQQLTELAVDVGSFNDAATADVARDFQSALVGNTETVRKYGVVITASNTKQKAYEMGLVGVNDELTEQQKLLVRVQQLIEGTADAQGDAERTGGSLANQQRALAASWERIVILVGDKLTPGLADAIGATADLIQHEIELQEALNLTGAVLTNTGERFEFLGVTGERLGATEEELIATAAKMRERFSEIDESVVDGWRRAMGGAAGAADDLAEANRSVVSSIGEVTEAQVAKLAIDALNQAYAEGDIDQQTYREGVGFVARDLLGVPGAAVDAQVAVAGLNSDMASGAIDALTYARELKNVIGLQEQALRTGMAFGVTPPPPPHIGGGLTAADIEGQHGLDFIAPPGFNRDNLLVGVSSGEHVKVTPASQVTNNNDHSRSALAGATVNINNQLTRKAFDQMLRNWFEV